MESVLWLTTAFMCSFLLHTQAVVPDRAAVLETLAWEEEVERAKVTSSLGCVLAEYLGDIETVEAAGAAARCGADSARLRHQGAAAVLNSELGDCLSNLNHTGSTTEIRQKDLLTLTRCLEERTRTTVSDTRVHITRLKSCLDTS